MPTTDGTTPAPSVQDLFLAHAQSVARWAARLGGPRMEVEDVVQEVFLVAARKLPGFRSQSSVTTWLYGITAKVVQARRRSARWRHWLRSEGEAPLAFLPDPAGSPLRQLESKQAHARVYALLDTLPEKHRTALILSELEGLSGERIAELMNAKPATVFVWVHRAKARLADKLSASGDAP